MVCSLVVPFDFPEESILQSVCNGCRITHHHIPEDHNPDFNCLEKLPYLQFSLCVCVCVRACMQAHACACACVCVWSNNTCSVF
jgi:hypothetical protein